MFSNLNNFVLDHHLHDHLADHLNSALHNNSIDHHLCSAVGVGVGRLLHYAIRAVISGKNVHEMFNPIKPDIFWIF